MPRPALDRPLTGAGLYALQSAPVFFAYAPGRDVIDVANDRPRAAHSVYFQVLGDLGFLGLAVYLGLLVTGFRNARWIARVAEGKPELDWMGDLARMIQVSMIAFCVSGAALSMAFYDYFLSLLIVLAAVRQMAMAPSRERRKAPSPRRQRDAAMVDTTAIAGIWQKAAHTKVTRLGGRRPGSGLVRGGGSAK